MDFNEYQAAAIETAKYPGQKTFLGLAYTALGLNGEAGETAEKVKKTWRDESADVQARVREAISDFVFYHCEPLTPQQAKAIIDLYQNIDEAFELQLSVDIHDGIVKELGDTLWYAAALADEIGVELSDVAEANIEKLRSRRERNVLGGSGDNR